MGVTDAVEAICGIIFWALVVYVIFYCCCRRNKDRGAVFTTVQPVPGETTRTIIGPGGNVTTTITPSTAYIGSQAPYPVQSGPYSAPAVVPAYPAPYQGAPYPYAAPAVPYPLHGGGGMPQPYQGVAPGGMAPPYPVGASANPPSYDQVVANEGYQKQAPYNPHYQGN